MRKELIYMLMALLLVGSAAVVLRPGTPALAQPAEGPAEGEGKDEMGQMFGAMMLSGIFSGMMPTQSQPPVVVDDEENLLIITDGLIYKIDKEEMRVTGTLELQSPAEKAVRMRDAVTALKDVFEGFED